MRLSSYFDDLFSSYGFEIEDLTYDSGGDDVLMSRLKVKRDQFADLLPMVQSHPVMVAPAFHGGFRFSSKEVLNQLVAGEPGNFPSWDTLKATIGMEPWAEALAKRALMAPGGEEFMLIAAGLEYILSRPGIHEAVSGDADADAEEENLEEDDGDSHDEDGDKRDLGDAGEDWLDDQGFDRRS